jgi:hypothetical protein
VDVTAGRWRWPRGDRGLRDHRRFRQVWQGIGLTSRFAARFCNASSPVHRRLERHDQDPRHASRWRSGAVATSLNGSRRGQSQRTLCTPAPTRRSPSPSTVGRPRCRRAHKPGRRPKLEWLFATNRQSGESLRHGCRRSLSSRRMLPARRSLCASHRKPSERRSHRTCLSGGRQLPRSPNLNVACSIGQQRKSGRDSSFRALPFAATVSRAPSFIGSSPSTAQIERLRVQRAPVSHPHRWMNDVPSQAPVQRAVVSRSDRSWRLRRCIDGLSSDDWAPIELMDTT